MPQPRKAAPAGPASREPDEAKAQANGQPASQPEDEASSPPSSTASSVADWITEPGPEFDAGQAGQDAGERDQERAFTVAPGEQQLLDVQWDPRIVRSLLEAQGSALHTLAGKGEDDWIYLKHELDAIAPAATRILNRYDTTRVAAATGDELSLIVGLSGYTIRSLQVRKRALDAQRAAEEAAEANRPPDQEQFGMPPIPEPEGGTSQ